MNEVFEKIIEELEKNASRYTKKYVTPYGNNGYRDTKAISVNKAIEIVKQEAEQYDNGWISCRERLPENDCYCLVTTSDMEIDIIKYGYSKGFGWDGFERIIAWQPLPQPFQKGE